MISIVLGTRPEIIKMMPLVKECQKRGLDFEVLHSGQHYSFEMDRVFFSQLELSEPDHTLEVGSGDHGEQSSKILSGCERVFKSSKPTTVLVQGDTNTVMAASLAAVKLGIPVGHVEAGLRSYDRTMPEEINRVISDHISSYLFAPTEQSKTNLAKEGIVSGVHVTGNTIVDSVLKIRSIANRDAKTIDQLGLKSGNFILATAHRAENVDSKDRLQRIITGINAVSEELQMPAVFPIHPRTRKMLEMHSIDTDSIRIIEPTGVIEFVSLEAEAALCMTDSGGVQEEACILRTPCMTMRENTERPETLDVGANVLVGTDVQKMVETARKMVFSKNVWENPFGDGRASERILDLIA